MPRRRLWIPAAIAGAGALSLLLPFAPVYDPWGWLVWGREIGSLDLDTSAGPSWKPLPVALTTLFALTGDAAPELWLFVARMGWIACPMLAGSLAWRLTIRHSRRMRLAAVLVAACSVLLIADSFTSWSRQFSGGLSEPLLVAVVLGAIDRGLAARHGQAFALGVAAALLRPEAWPFLVLFGIWLWGRNVARGWLVAAAVAIPVLWLVPDLIGSGDPLTGAGRARGATGWSLGEGIESLGRSLDLVLWPLWATAAFAVVEARRRAEAAVPILAWIAIAWIGIVALMAVAGYAGLPRFAAPAGALAVVLGAVGLADLADEVGRARRLADRLRAVGLGMLVRGRRYRRGVGAAIALGCVLAGLAIQAAFRVEEIPGEVESAVEFHDDVMDLDSVTDRTPATECQPLTIADLYFQTALAWQLDQPISSVGVRLEAAPARGTFVVGARSPARVEASARGAGRRVAREGDWTVYRLACG